MNVKRKVFLLAAAIVASNATGASAAERLRVAGFGPPVHGDASLDASMGVLAQNIAWRRSPESDVFALALAAPPLQPFANVALESDPMHGASFSPAVRGDASLDANEAALTRWIAYRNSPKGNPFGAAEPETTAVASANFVKVTLAAIPPGSMDYGDR